MSTTSRRLGKCTDLVVYHDGGITSFTQDVTVNNWWLTGTAPEVQDFLIGPLARGFWVWHWEVVSPTPIILPPGTGPGFGIPVNSVTPYIGPDPSGLSVVASAAIGVPLGYVDFPGAPYDGEWGYDVVWADDGSGVATPKPAQWFPVCVYNESATGDCAFCTPDCVITPAGWDDVGYDGSTSRNVLIETTNGGTPFGAQDLAVWEASWIPNYTTIRVWGSLGYSPP